MINQSNEHPHKTSWYDGWFYAFFIDPLSGKPFSRVIKKMINQNDTLIEIGCGTGSLAMSLAPTCNSIIAVDISPKMIQYANKLKNKGSFENIEFRLVNANDHLADLFDSTFDGAIAKMVLHETNQTIRDQIIHTFKKISNYAILTDWVHPQPKGIHGYITRIIEYTAGKEHYHNFLNWCSIGGLDGFIKMHQLKTIQEKPFKDGTGKIVKVTWD